MSNIDIFKFDEFVVCYIVKKLDKNELKVIRKIMIEEIYDLWMEKNLV